MSLLQTLASSHFLIGLFNLLEANALQLVVALGFARLLLVTLRLLMYLFAQFLSKIFMAQNVL